MVNLKCRTTPWGSALVNCYCGVRIIDLLEERNRGEEVCSLIIGVAIYKTCLSHSQLWNLFLCQREWSCHHLVPYTSQSYTISVFFVGLLGNHKSLLFYYKLTATMSTEDRPLERTSQTAEMPGIVMLKSERILFVAFRLPVVLLSLLRYSKRCILRYKVKGDLRLKFANPTPL